VVYINSSGTTELFTGAYSKRVEQNRQFGFELVFGKGISI